jgi:anti-sigma factor RsiW
MTAEHQEPEMPRCREAEGLLVRAADGSTLTAAEGERLERHLESCAACRAELGDQRRVVRTMLARTVTPVPAGFEARLAARLGDASGLLGLANWRAWTVGLLPVAGGLVLMAYFGVGAGAADALAVVSESASGYTATTPAGMFLQPVSNSDVLLEAVLTGTVPGDANVR